MGNKHCTIEDLTPLVFPPGNPTTVLDEQMQYDANYGRIKAQGNPAAPQATEILYDKYGYVTTERKPNTAGEIYRTVRDLSVRGQVEKETLGNGLVQSFGYYNSTGQFADQRTRIGEAGAILDQFLYQYDAMGNLDQVDRTYTSTTQREIYAYDQVQRLTSTNRTINGATVPAISYAYQANGNLSKKSDFSQNSPNAYSYPAVGSGKPHAVSQVVRANGQSEVFSYDNNGNQTGSTLAGLSHFQASYDHDNRPLAMSRVNEDGSGTAQTAFHYGPGGQRYFEIGTESTVLRAGSYEKSIDATGTTERWTLGGGVTLTRSNGVVKKTWITGDRLGSTVMLTDEAGAVLQRRSYDAFGASRNGDLGDRPGGTLDLRPVTLNGFTGHEHLDSLKLIHMNGRAYDYRLGRFLSVDPIIQFPTNSQSLNPYSHIMNNPLSGTDPTGYASACDMMVGRDRTVCMYNDNPQNNLRNRIGGKKESDFWNGAREWQSIIGAVRELAKKEAAEINYSKSWLIQQQGVLLDYRYSLASSASDGGTSAALGELVADEMARRLLRDSKDPEVRFRMAKFLASKHRIMGDFKTADEIEAFEIATRPKPDGSVAFKKWKPGDAIDKPMPNGSSPKWSVVQTRYWKNRAQAAAWGEFDSTNLERMRNGTAPQDPNPRTGLMESRELHHVMPRRHGGSNSPINLRELTPEWHAEVDPYRQIRGIRTTRGIR